MHLFTCCRFEHSSIILFLNKRDLFEAKIKTVDLRHEGSEASPARFLDYTGGCNAKAAQKYILDKFIELRRGERPIYSHVTCATDTDNVRVVFGACKETILKENMKNSVSVPSTCWRRYVLFLSGLGSAFVGIHDIA